MPSPQHQIGFFALHLTICLVKQTRPASRTILWKDFVAYSVLMYGHTAAGQGTHGRLASFAQTPDRFFSIVIDVMLGESRSAPRYADWKDGFRSVVGL